VSEAGQEPRAPATDGLALLADDLRGRDRELWLAALMAPAAARAGLVTLFAIDCELAQVVATTSEPMVGAIRLAWWREALEGLDAGQVRAAPVLEAAAAVLLPAGLSGAELAGLEARWGSRLAGDMDEAAERAAQAEGGALLFGLAARLLGGDAGLAAALGRGWAVGEAGWAGRAGAVPGTLRPLLALAVLGVRDARDAAAGRARAPRGTAGRQLRMWWAIASGR
jgi:phytoene synthase